MVVMIVLLPVLPYIEKLNNYSKYLMLLEGDMLFYSRIEIEFARSLTVTFRTEDVVSVCAS